MPPRQGDQRDVATKWDTGSCVPFTLQWTLLGRLDGKTGQTDFI